MSCKRGFQCKLDYLHPWEELIFWQVYGYNSVIEQVHFSLRGCMLEFSPAAPDLPVKLSHWGGSNYSAMLMHNSVQSNYLYQCMSNVMSGCNWRMS